MKVQFWLQHITTKLLSSRGVSNYFQPSQVPSTIGPCALLLSTLLPLRKWWRSYRISCDWSWQCDEHVYCALLMFFTTLLLAIKWMRRHCIRGNFNYLIHALDLIGELIDFILSTVSHFNTYLSLTCHWIALNAPFNFKMKKYDRCCDRKLRIWWRIHSLKVT